MEETKPIKRSKELAPLSREHHEGLLFCWKLKQGLAHGTATDILINYTHWYYSNHLESHFRDEEKVFTKYLPADDRLVQQMLQEHARIREIIGSLHHSPKTSSVEQLAELINDHIRFEERKLFVYAEKVLSPEQLKAIFDDLPDDLHCHTDAAATGWEDEFWLKKK